MSEDITKTNTISKFMKSYVDKRISGDAIEAMLKHLNKIALEMTEKADSSCTSEDRSTILDRDVNGAFETIGGWIEATPEGIFKAVEEMGAESIGRIAILIADWVKENKS